MHKARIGTTLTPCKLRTAIFKLDHRSRALNRSAIMGPRMRSFRAGGRHWRRREAPTRQVSPEIIKALEAIAASAAARGKLDTIMYRELVRKRSRGSASSGSDARFGSLGQCIQLLEAITPPVPPERYTHAVEQLLDPIAQELFLVMTPDLRAAFVLSWE